MDIKFIGTGGAFDYEFGNSSAIVTFRDKNYLIDCGHSVYNVLRSNYDIGKIDYVLITHFHADHVGSLSTFILHHQYFVDNKQLQILYPDVEFREMLYDFLKFSLMVPEKFIVFIPIEKHPGVESINTYGAHLENMPSYGYYFIDDEAELLGYSGDLGDSDLVFDVFDEIKARRKRVFHEISFDPHNPNHTYYEELERRLDSYEIYGYHCDPRQSPQENSVPLVYHQPDYLL